MGELLILGAGGQGKVVLDCAIATRQYSKVSFLDDNKVGEEILGCHVIGKLIDYISLRSEYTHAIVAIGNNTLRVQLVKELMAAGYEVPVLIHPHAIVSRFSRIGQGTVVLAGAVINAGCEIGKGVIVNTTAIVEHDCHVADGVHLSPGCNMGGEVSIGERTWVCIGAVIIHQIKIGSDCVIAAGAVVIHDIPNGTKVYGVPAQKKEIKVQPLRKTLILANHDLGLYNFRKELIQALINKGHEVYISLPKGERVQELMKMGCKFIPTKVDRRGINVLKDIKLYLAYKKAIKKIVPDQVLTYTIKPNIYGGIACKMRHTPYFSNITGLGSAFQKRGLLKKVIILLYKVALAKAKYAFFENEGNKNIFIEYGILNEDKAVVMRGAGVNLEEYPVAPLPSEESGIRLLFIGRVMKEKGVDELFAVAEKIRKNYPEIQFDVVGPFEEHYEKIIEKLTKKEIIHYYGYQQDVKPFIAKAHCLVLPSYHEGMANTLLEAAAMGRPLITSNIYGCKEAVSDNGYLVDVKDEEDLYQKIETFIHLTPEEKATMGERSRKHMEEVFDKKKVVERTLNYIEEGGKGAANSDIASLYSIK